MREKREKEKNKPTIKQWALFSYQEPAKRTIDDFVLDEVEKKAHTKANKTNN